MRRHKPAIPQTDLLAPEPPAKPRKKRASRKPPKTDLFFMPDGRMLSPVRPFRVLNLGAGVQSSTLLMMAVEAPEHERPDAVVFADTQWEPKDVYEHLERLAGVECEGWYDDEGRLRWRAVPGLYYGGLARLPVYVVTKGDIRSSLYHASSTGKRYASLPLFVKNLDGSRGIGRRQCTKEYKIEPITLLVRQLLGIPKGRPGPTYEVVEQWFGISMDEAWRVKDSRYRYIRNRYPLIERNMVREDCHTWSASRGLPRAPKSACKACPYTDDMRWQAMKENAPEDFVDAVDFDREIRMGGPRGKLRGENYVHSSLLPLDQVDFLNPRRVEGQDDAISTGFQDECEGMCGV